MLVTKNNRKKSKPIHPAARTAWNVFRWTLFPLLCVAGLLIGLRLGYVRFGGGDSGDVLQWETWKHMFDLVFMDP